MINIYSNQWKFKNLRQNSQFPLYRYEIGFNVQKKCMLTFSLEFSTYALEFKFGLLCFIVHGNVKYGNKWSKN